MRGAITVDGHPKEQAAFARISGYVEQVQGTLLRNIPILLLLLSLLLLLLSLSLIHLHKIKHALCFYQRKCASPLKSTERVGPSSDACPLLKRKARKPMPCPQKWTRLSAQNVPLWCRTQFDIHSPATTVREALAFSAELRLADVQPAQLHSFVDEVWWMLFITAHQTCHLARVLPHSRPVNSSSEADLNQRPNGNSRPLYYWAFRDPFSRRIALGWRIIFVF